MIERLFRKVPFFLWYPILPYAGGLEKGIHFLRIS